MQAKVGPSASFVIDDGRVQLAYIGRRFRRSEETL